MNLIDGIVLVVHRVRNNKQTHISRPRECTIQIFRSGIGFKALVSRINLSNGLLETLFERPSDSHDLTDRLHSRADLPVDLGRELGQVPFWNFGDNIIQGRLEASSGGLRDGVGKFG